MTALGGGKARLRQALPAVALLAILLLPGRAAATTFTPTTTADGVNGACTPALCTLRDAVAAADTSSGDTVSVPAGVYRLTLGELTIDTVMTIAGPNARTTLIDGDGTDRVLNLNSGANATIRDLSITGGSAGGLSSFPAGDGGGIVNQGEMRLERVAVVGNTAEFGGGGIMAPFEAPVAPPTTTIVDSLIANNTVTGGTGGFANGQGGGAALFGDATIINTTITGNLIANPGTNQGGGLLSARDASPSPAQALLTLINTTIAGNRIVGLPPGGLTPSFGGGLSGHSIGPQNVDADMTARNTIIAGNTVDGSIQDCGLVGARSTSFNLSSDATCDFRDPGSKQNANPQLLPLANNGGATNTLAIADGSPALNAGTNSGCPAADQRGVTRPQALICDIGAYERKGPDLVVEQRLSKEGMGKSAAVATRKRGKRLGFVATVTNKGEQTAPNALLTVKLPKGIGKVKLTGCEKAGKKGKRKKKRKRRRGKKVFVCGLGNVAPGASRTVRIKFRPKRKGKIVSKVVVSSTIPDTNTATDTARTKLRVKRAKRRR